MSKVDSNTPAPVPAQQQSQADVADATRPKTPFNQVLEDAKQKQPPVPLRGQTAAPGRMGVHRPGVTPTPQKPALSSQPQVQQAVKLGENKPARLVVEHHGKESLRGAEQARELVHTAQTHHEGAQVLNQRSTEAKRADHGRLEDREVDSTREQVRDDSARAFHAESGAAERARRAMQALEGRLAASAHHEQQSTSTASAPGATGAQQVAASQVKGAKKAQEIPQELLESLVEEVRVGVNKAGETEFQIDLKQGVLEGMQVSVTSQDGHVSCNFQGGSAQARNLVESSRGSLARALEARGLHLEKLVTAA